MNFQQFCRNIFLMNLYTLRYVFWSWSLQKYSVYVFRELLKIFCGNFQMENRVRIFRIAYDSELEGTQQSAHKDFGAQYKSSSFLKYVSFIRSQTAENNQHQFFFFSLFTMFCLSLSLSISFSLSHKPCSDFHLVPTMHSPIAHTHSLKIFIPAIPGTPNENVLNRIIKFRSEDRNNKKNS